MLNTLAAGASALALLTSPLTAASGPLAGDPWGDGDVPPAITISIVTVNGSGCAPGTAAVAVSPDKTAFTVTYSNYLAQYGDTYDKPAARRNCQLNLKVDVVGGYTYAIAKADYRGFADLDKSNKALSAVQQASYYFQGDQLTGVQRHNIAKGADNFEFNDEVPVNALIFSKCNVKRNLNVNTELQLKTSDGKKPKALSYATMDSTDISVSTIYHFAFKKCQETGK